MEFRTTVNLAREFRARGLDVVRFNFLYREREQGPPDPPSWVEGTLPGVIFAPG